MGPSPGALGSIWIMARGSQGLIKDVNNFESLWDYFITEKFQKSTNFLAELVQLYPWNVHKVSQDLLQHSESHHLIHESETESLTHWGRVTHRCVSKLTIIDWDNGFSPDRHQAIIWTNAAILLIGHSGTNFSEIFIEILTFSFEKMRLKVSSAKRRPFCLGLNVLRA